MHEFNDKKIDILEADLRLFLEEVYDDDTATSDLDILGEAVEAFSRIGSCVQRGGAIFAILMVDHEGRDERFISDVKMSIRVEVTDLETLCGLGRIKLLDGS